MKKLFKKGTALLLVATMLVTAMVTGVSAEGIYITVDETNKYIFANGYDLTLEEAEDGTAIYVDGNIVNTTIGEDTDGTNGYDLSEYTIFGGSQDTILDTTVSITVNGGEVKAIYAGGTAVFTTDIEAELTELEETLTTAIEDIITSLSDFDDDTTIYILALISQLEELSEEFESKLEEADGVTTDMLEIIEAYIEAIEDTILPYISEEAETYVGEVAALLLESLEIELTEYYEDLIDTLEEKATTVAIASLFDAISALTGITLSDVDDVYDLIDAVTVIATYDSNLASAEATYNSAVAALEAYEATKPTSTTTAPTEPTEPTEPVQTDSLLSSVDDIVAAALAAITYDEVNALVNNYSWAGTIDVEALLDLVQNNNFSDILDVYDNNGWHLNYAADLTNFANLASDITTLISEKTTEASSNYYADADEYEAANAAYETALTQYNSDLEEYNSAYEQWQKGNAEYLTDLADYEDGLTAYETAVSTANSAVSAVTTEYYSAYATLVSLGLSNADSLADFDIDNIYFIVDLVSLLTEFDTTDITSISDLITDLEDLVEEYGMEETIEQLIEDIIANIEAEFNEEFLLEEVENLETALTDAIENFESLLGTEGYPASPEDKIQEIIEEVISILEDTVTDDEYDDLISALESLVDYENFETIALNIYTELAEYILTGEATVEGIQDIIVNQIYESIAETIIELMEIEMTYIEYAEITVNGGYVGDIYAYGADAGYYVAEVIITYYEGTVGNIDDTELVFDGSTIDLSSLGFGDYITSYLESVLSDIYYELNSVTVIMLTVDDTEVDPDDDETEEEATPDVDEEDTTIPDDDTTDDTTTPDDATPNDDDTTDDDTTDDTTTEDEDETEEDDDDDSDVVQTGDTGTNVLVVVAMFTSLLGVFVVSKKRLAK